MLNRKSEWVFEWERMQNISPYLFANWIYPNKLKDFKNKTVLDCGCGMGGHINLVAPIAKKVVGVDLYTSHVAKKNTKHNKNVTILRKDITTMRLKEKFDIVYAVGVIHHTENPDKTFQNIKRHLKKNGRLIIWVYSYEGNFLNRTLLEFLKKKFFLKLSRSMLLKIATLITFLIYIPVYTIYMIPIDFLPFYQYFTRWRKLSFRENLLNIFDKLNAPKTFFIKRETIEKWFNRNDFRKIHISNYLNTSWRASGIKK